MDAERKARMLELEEAKQAKMIEIEATNAKTKAKEAVLASMNTGVEIMKVDVNTVSLRKRLWFEKMQAEMLKSDDLLSGDLRPFLYGGKCADMTTGRHGVFEFPRRHVCRSLASVPT
ncbi:Protein UXT-like protein [Hordeum vulgare]|nr:Protein UXT-like protein [Hordeum vulgare]